MNLNLPTSRGRFTRFGMGDAVPYYCSQPQCQVPGTNCGGCPVNPGTAPGSSSSPSGWSSNVPTGQPVYANIPVGGFTGDFQVMTLDSFLSTVLAAKESPFIANSIARGADTVANQANDFQAQADSYCSINGALPDCGQKAQLVAKYKALFLAWAGGQSASIYQAGDTGTLSNPINALTNSAPTYTPPPNTNPTNVLSPPATGNPTAGSKNVTGQTDQTQSTDSTSDITAWLQANWILVAAGVAAVVVLPSLMKGR